MDRFQSGIPTLEPLLTVPRLSLSLAPTAMIYQCYVNKDRPATERILKKVQEKGCQAVMLTVDVSALNERSRVYVSLLDRLDADSRTPLLSPPSRRLLSWARERRTCAPRVTSSRRELAEAAARRVAAESLRPLAASLTPTWPGRMSSGTESTATFPCSSRVSGAVCGETCRHLSSTDPSPLIGNDPQESNRSRM